MTFENQEPALDVAGEDVPETVVETVVETADEPEKLAEIKTEEPEKSKSQERKERRKAQISSIMQQKDEATARLASITKAGEIEAAPNEDDFENAIEYVAASAIWGATQKANDRMKSDAEESVETLDKQVNVEVEDAWNASMIEAAVKYSDFEAVALNGAVPLSPAMIKIIKEMDNGADVAYHLGSNLDVAQNISLKSPVEAALAIGRIEATLARPTTANNKNSQAPEPINPVSPKGTARVDPSNMSMGEFRKWRESGGD
jgi:hypothetical protein